MNKHDIENVRKDMLRETINKEMLKVYPWWDSCYLMQMMIVWLETAEKEYKEKGSSVVNERQSKHCKVMALLLKRIIEEDYREMKVFKNRPQISLWRNAEKQRNFDLEYFSKLFNKHILGIWD